MRRRRSSVSRPVVKATVQDVPRAMLRRVRSAALEGTGSEFGISRESSPSHLYHKTERKHRGARVRINERGLVVVMFEVMKGF